MKFMPRMPVIAAGLLLAAALPFAGAHAQMADLKSLPGGGALKDVPSFQDLPGVNLDVSGAAGFGATGDNCREERVPSFNQYGVVSGTMTTCDFGRFSIGTMSSGGSGHTLPGMQQFHGHYHPIPQGWRHE